MSDIKTLSKNSEATRASNDKNQTTSTVKKTVEATKKMDRETPTAPKKSNIRSQKDFLIENSKPRQKDFSKLVCLYEVCEEVASSTLSTSLFCASINCDEHQKKSRKPKKPTKVSIGSEIIPALLFAPPCSLVAFF